MFYFHVLVLNFANGDALYPLHVYNISMLWHDKKFKKGTSQESQALTSKRQPKRFVVHLQFHVKKFKLIF